MFLCLIITFKDLIINVGGFSENLVKCSVPLRRESSSSEESDGIIKTH